jgi:uncharacterized membrane protein YwzB
MLSIAQLHLIILCIFIENNYWALQANILPHLSRVFAVTCNFLIERPSFISST